MQACVRALAVKTEFRISLIGLFSTIKNTPNDDPITTHRARVLLANSYSVVLCKQLYVSACARDVLISESYNFYCVQVCMRNNMQIHTFIVLTHDG